MAKRKTSSKQKDSGGRTSEVAEQLEHAFLAGLGALANTQKVGSALSKPMVTLGMMYYHLKDRL